MRVLVVSEDPKERARASSALELTADMQVTEATTAADARQRILDHGERFDVLVVDGDLYPRGGFGLLYDLRSHNQLEGTAPVPSLIMASREQDRWLGKWAGADQVMLKPVDPFDLARAVVALQGVEVRAYGDRDSAAAQVAAAMRDGR